MEICNYFSSIRKPPNLFLRPNFHRFIRCSAQAPQAPRARILEELRKETERTLEWHSICLQISAFTSTSMGRSHAQNGKLPIGRDREESEKLLHQTAAAASLPRRLDFSGIEDVGEIVSSSVAGELRSTGELCLVHRTLQSARGVFEQLQDSSLQDGEDADRYSPLLDIIQNCNFLTELERKIGLCIDCNLSIVLDRASEKLEFIRLERKRNMQSLESLLKGIATSIYQAGGIDSPLVTKRRSRMCVGIRASHKSLLADAVILDVSSSGATYFMEPRDAVDLNNMEVRLSNSEKAEELAILSFLTSEIAESEVEIRYLMEKILELDLASARGAHAQWIDGECPVFTDCCAEVHSNKPVGSLSVDIKGIQHPLLLEFSLRSLNSISKSDLESSSAQLDWSNGKMEKRRTPAGTVDFPVPLDIQIGCRTKVVVISGPNTGGKTATMKTLGLASLMSKAGMFFPAEHHPRLPWFNHILADIGDHQSLEHNLSTFSGHISCICKIMEVATEDSLILIDEIGNGTDPAEGVALAISILEHLADQVNLAVVTTHYSDLSLLKLRDARFENAAMEFSMKTLQPTYRVLWGSTGNSNALSIAKSIGFDQKLLDRAHEWVKKLTPDQQKERKGLLYQYLMEERNKLEVQASKAAAILSEIKKLHNEIVCEAEDLDQREAAIKAKESRQIQQELKAAKSQIDAVVKNFESQLNPMNSDRLNALLKQSEAAIASIVESHCPRRDSSIQQSSNTTAYVPQVGDQVLVKGFGNKLATVVEASGDDATMLVQFGKMKVLVKKKDIKAIPADGRITKPSSSVQFQAKAQRQKLKQVNKESNTSEQITYGPAVRTSKNTVNLRGMRVEEATLHLLMAISSTESNKVLFVIHGMGTGAVKERALDILSNHPRVAKFEQESPMNYGCTVAYIK